YAIPSAYTVRLYDSSNALIGNFTEGTSPLKLWSEDMFTYSGGTPISLATIAFSDVRRRRTL
ncbi:MAG: hypothetical protein ACYSUX_08125, partial [Planctomycetota bacterium]